MPLVHSVGSSQSQLCFVVASARWKSPFNYRSRGYWLADDKTRTCIEFEVIPVKFRRSSEMKLTPLLRGARTPQNVNKVPFQAILPLTLKPKVSGKGEKTSDFSCLQEMAILFACLKDHDFNEQQCSKEIQQFKSCYNESLEKKDQRKRLEAKGSVGVSAATATSLTINRVMRRFPPE